MISLNTVSQLPLLPIVKLQIIDSNMESEQKRFDNYCEILNAGGFTKHIYEQYSFLRKSIKGQRIERNTIFKTLNN